jgi:phosphatidylinositol alpha-mannosyltransferase
MKRQAIKVGIVCPYNLFRHGGVQEHVRAEYDILTQLGYSVKIIAPKPTDNSDMRQKDVVLLGRATAMKFNAPFHTLFDVSAAEGEAIDSLLAKQKFDIIHLHEPWLPMLPYQILQRAEAITVGTLHGTWPDSVVNNSIEKLIKPYVRPALRRLDHLTAVSLPPIKRIEGLTEKNVTIIPNGIRLDVYNPAKTEYYSAFHDDVPTILYIGRLEKRKGVDHLVKAFKVLQEQINHPIRLVIAGNGPKRTALETYIERFEVQNVEFLGWISESDKLKLLKTCDVFCAPSIFGESFGIVLLEAMAMGAPIVAGINSGYEAVLNGIGTLSFIDPHNHDEFARRLRIVLEEEQVRSMLKAWGSQEVIQYDYPKVIARYDELFQTIMKA